MHRVTSLPLVISDIKEKTACPDVKLEIEAITPTPANSVVYTRHFLFKRSYIRLHSTKSRGPAKYEIGFIMILQLCY